MNCIAIHYHSIDNKCGIQNIFSYRGYRFIGFGSFYRDTSINRDIDILAIKTDQPIDSSEALKRIGDMIQTGRFVSPPWSFQIGDRNFDIVPAIPISGSKFLIPAPFWTDNYHGRWIESSCLVDQRDIMKYLAEYKDLKLVIKTIKTFVKLLDKFREIYSYIVEISCVRTAMRIGNRWNKSKFETNLIETILDLNSGFDRKVIMNFTNDENLLNRINIDKAIICIKLMVKISSFMIRQNF